MPLPVHGKDAICNRVHGQIIGVACAFHLAQGDDRPVCVAVCVWNGNGGNDNRDGSLGVRVVNDHSEVSHGMAGGQGAIKAAHLGKAFVFTEGFLAIFANHLLFFEAQQPFSTTVKGGDLPVVIDREDGIDNLCLDILLRGIIHEG